MFRKKRTRFEMDNGVSFHRSDAKELQKRQEDRIYAANRVQRARGMLCNARRSISHSPSALFERKIPACFLKNEILHPFVSPATKHSVDAMVEHYSMLMESCFLTNREGVEVDLPSPEYVSVKFSCSFSNSEGVAYDKVVHTKLHWQVGVYPVAPVLIEVEEPRLSGYVGHALMELPHARLGPWIRASARAPRFLIDIVAAMRSLLDACVLQEEGDTYHPLEVELAHVASMIDVDGAWRRRPLPKGLAEWCDSHDGFAGAVHRHHGITVGDDAGINRGEGYESTELAVERSRAADATVAEARTVERARDAKQLAARVEILRALDERIAEKFDERTPSAVVNDSCLGPLVARTLEMVDACSVLSQEDRLRRYTGAGLAGDGWDDCHAIAACGSIVRKVLTRATAASFLTDVIVCVAEAAEASAALALCSWTRDWIVVGRKISNAQLKLTVAPSTSSEDAAYRTALADVFFTEVDEFVRHAYGADGRFYHRSDYRGNEGARLLQSVPPSRRILAERGEWRKRSDLRHHESASFEIWSDADTRMLTFITVGPMNNENPYQGTFTFDAVLPSDYPLSPPVVSMHYTSQGRHGFNPNCYPDGELCLSVLNTFGDNDWVPGTSGLRQIILSIQAFLFDADGYHNEPGREKRTIDNTRKARLYNQTTRECSMLYAMVLPILAALDSCSLNMKLLPRYARIPPHRPELVRPILGHFALKARWYLALFAEWIDDPENLNVNGGEGFVISDVVQGVEEEPAPKEICELGSTHRARLQTLRGILDELFLEVQRAWQRLVVAGSSGSSGSPGDDAPRTEPTPLFCAPNSA